MLRCRVLGHRFRFSADAAVMRWTCERCPETGEKTYPDPESAARYAAAFDRQDDPTTAGRGSLTLLPLRLLGRIRRGD